jgi:hypothetical protein
MSGRTYVTQCHQAQWEHRSWCRKPQKVAGDGSLSIWVQIQTAHINHTGDVSQSLGFEADGLFKLLEIFVTHHYFRWLNTTFELETHMRHEYRLTHSADCTPSITVTSVLRTKNKYCSFGKFGWKFWIRLKHNKRKLSSRAFKRTQCLFVEQSGLVRGLEYVRQTRWKTPWRLSIHIMSFEVFTISCLGIPFPKPFPDSNGFKSFKRDHHPTPVQSASHPVPRTHGVVVMFFVLCYFHRIKKDKRQGQKCHAESMMRKKDCEEQRWKHSRGEVLFLYLL